MADPGYHGCLRLKIAIVIRKSWLVDHEDVVSLCPLSVANGSSRSVRNATCLCC